MRPRLLDLFCGQGGAAVGYSRAGFDVVGVDLTRQPRYPFEFHQADALEYLHDHGHEFDAVHASPPCQHATAGNRALRAQGRSKHPALIEPTRALLVELDAMTEGGKPWVIENVSGAALLEPVTLCGTMFGLSAEDEDGTPLEMWRHRLFESNVALRSRGTCRHGAFSEQVAGSYGGARRDKVEARDVRHGGYVPSKVVQQRLLGIDWMTEAGMYQSLPPVYTLWIGSQLRRAA